MIGSAPNTSLSDISSETELIHVSVENPGDADECIIFPEKATEKELQTKWIRAKEGSYIPSQDAQ